MRTVAVDLTEAEVAQILDGLRPVAHEGRGWAGGDTPTLRALDAKALIAKLEAVPFYPSAA